mgnify:FL=1
MFPLIHRPFEISSHSQGPLQAFERLLSKAHQRGATLDASNDTLIISGHLNGSFRYYLTYILKLFNI